MNVLNIVIFVFTVIFSGIFGSVAGDVIRDVLWAVGDRTIPNCENLQEDWEKLCLETNQEYYNGKTLFRIGGFFIPFILVIVFLRNLIS